MAITPADINNKQFSKKIKGYNPDEVNDFLDRVTLEMESLVKEKRELEKKIKFMGEQVEHYMSLQDTLNKSIVVAQDAADRLRENAEKESDMIISEAQNKADDIIASATEQAIQVATETETLRKTAIVFRKKFQLLVESQLDLIKNEEWNDLLTMESEIVETPTIDQILEEKPVIVDTTELDKLL